MFDIPRNYIIVGKTKANTFLNLNEAKLFEFNEDGMITSIDGYKNIYSPGELTKKEIVSFNANTPFKLVRALETQNWTVNREKFI